MSALLERPAVKRLCDALAAAESTARVIDSSLGRFATVYAAAGHPHCVFATCVDALASLTGGAVVGDVAVES